MHPHLVRPVQIGSVIVHLLGHRYLEKRIGEHSGRQNLPEGWKWQKRWFVFTDTKGMLYYFKTADDPPNYRGVIDIKCAPCDLLSAEPIMSPITHG
jgi:hypothetical protein